MEGSLHDQERHFLTSPGAPTLTSCQVQEVASSPDIPQSTSQWRLFDMLKISSSPKLKEKPIEPTKQHTDPANDIIVSNCICCATLLSHPQISSKFECSICHTVNLLKDFQDYYMKDSHVPHTISFRYVKRVAEKCLADAHDNQHKTLHEIFEPLSNYLYTAFQNYGCVNNSFKVKKSSSKIHYSTSNINYEDIQKVFDLLTKLPTKRPLYNALQGCSTLLRRIPVSFGEDARNYCFLLIMFQIPLLSHALTHYESKSNPPCTRMIDSPEIKALCYDVIKRVLGILSNIKSVRVKNYITSWFSRYSSSDFVSKVDLINVYITFHMKKYFYIANNPEHRRKLSIPSPGNNVDEEYFQNSSFKEQIEQMNSGSSPLPTGPLNFGRTKSKKSKDSTTKIRIYQYGNDWHLKTASIVLQSFLEAYNIRADSLHVSIFYNSLVDYVNLKMDFDSWISNKKFKDQKPGDNPELSVVIDYINGNQNSFASSATFFFSKYPFLITLGNKISILEYEAKRIMERKAEEAFINSLDRRVPLDVYFRVRVRRSHFVQDSLNCILANQQNLKKSLKVQFVGEAGIDAGGLRKEWFLLLTKAMLSPETGMLVNVEESNYHWFNLVPINNVDNYYLFGAVLGLAVYNSTILELNFPIAFYKMLLKIPLGFSDFEQLHPDLSRNLFKIKSLSDEELNMLDLSFEISIFDLFHNVVNRELVPDGKNIQVTSKNRDLYIEKYAKFRLTDGVAEQTDSLLKGFCSVTSGNGLSLFSPEEIQLLLCGNEEGKLDLEILRSVTKYLGWKDSEEAQNSQLINWLWEYLNELSYKEQKKFLSFVTGSDRIPATGIQNLNLTIKKAGSESERLPTAHTCFNELEIHRYATKEKLYEKLSMAIQGSSGFGIK